MSDESPLNVPPDEPNLPVNDKPKTPHKSNWGEYKPTISDKQKSQLTAWGRPRRMILESEILAAQSMAKTEKQVALKLGVAYVTYQKYATMYGIYGRVMNRAGRGINKPVKNENGGKYPLNRILLGEFPDYPIARLRLRLIRSNKIEPKCCTCGFCSKREIDGKYPLILGFKDGNKKNKLEANLQLYCYNCYFMNVNAPHGRQTTFKLDGIDREDLADGE